MEKRKKVNEYLKRIKEGEECMSELYEYTYVYVRHMANKYLTDRENVKDVISETYRKVIENIEKFDEEKNGYNWICKIAHNEALNANKRGQREGVREERADREEWNVESKYDLERAIGRLSEEDRALLEYRVFEDRSYKEITALLGLTPVQAHRRLNKIFKQLKNLLS